MIVRAPGFAGRSMTAIEVQPSAATLLLLPHMAPRVWILNLSLL